MRSVRQRGTDAELKLRRVLSDLGIRYRLNVHGLPGRPDVVNTSRRKVIFVHGCFWHHHDVCGRGKIPTANARFWTAKLRGNVARDTRKIAGLVELGYDVLVVWECELLDSAALARRVRRFWNRSPRRNATPR